jgi:hypothetical protein
MKRMLGLTVLLVLATTMVLAHGNEQHVMGTVTKITHSAITVKTTDARIVDVSLTTDTKFTKEGQPMSAKNIKQGDRVVIHAKKNGEKLVATTVIIGPVKTDHMQGDMKGVASPTDKTAPQPH